MELYSTASTASEILSATWFEFINSARNIADLPSRGQLGVCARMLNRRYRRPTWPRAFELSPLRAA